jgi:hypothetical protein
MNRTLAAIGMMGAVLVGAQAHAVNPTPQSTLNRRQLMDCMTKQMSASRTISYNEATKVCRNQLKLQNDSLAVNNTAKPVAAR